ncbi:restriction endonuclease subunit S [Wenzhouxiangella sp. AB-CW3]|uniref:restriction endonuclease subunit S n=1 Tax=Wenzhouxiangella sp. AB-CW3 TaxID=2771012 RepID=UPI00168BD5B5|nr:restriction endonuclease subunit S [Wenzhouxiangella sp. AB-CW3]
MTNGQGQIKTLGDVLKLEYGKPLPKEKRKNQGKYPVFGANGVKCFTDVPFHAKSSIIVGRKGTAGAVNLVDGGFWPLDVTYFVTLVSG